MLRAVREFDLRFEFFAIDEGDGPEELQEKILGGEIKTAGVFIPWYLDPFEKLRKDLAEKGITCVFYNTPAEYPGINQVILDQRKAAEMSVARLIANGCRNIAFLGSTEGGDYTGTRYQGYLDALKAAGIVPDPSIIFRAIPLNEPEAAAAACEGMLQHATGIQAFFTDNTDKAFAVAEFLKANAAKGSMDIFLGTVDLPSSKKHLMSSSLPRSCLLEKSGYEAVKLMLDILLKENRGTCKKGRAL